jgi:hypothetical protein
MMKFFYEVSKKKDLRVNSWKIVSLLVEI